MMTQIRQLFDVFSRRQMRSPAPVTPLTQAFRQRVLMRCMEVFGAPLPHRVGQHFWDEIYGMLRYLVGRGRLVESIYIQEMMEDICDFLIRCGDSQFLDFMDCVFKTKRYQQNCRSSGIDMDFLVEDFNEFLLTDDLPYAVTHFVWEIKTQSFHNRVEETSVLIANPRVVRRDDQVTHVWAIDPALTLLRDQQFTSANKEFLEALEDYRKGDYDDCLGKCGSAFESTMKIICERKNWCYKQDDTAKPLLDTIVKEAGLPGFFGQPLLIIATLRNKLSSSHGSGTQPREVSQHFAKYAINATAAAILLLVEECL